MVLLYEPLSETQQLLTLICINETKIKGTYGVLTKVWFAKEANDEYIMFSEGHSLS